MRETKLGPLVFFGLLSAASLAYEADAGASVSVALSLDDLARGSELVARVVPIDQVARWEGGRIVTSSRVRIDAVIAGAPGGAEVEVKTLGGVVDGVGQFVDGEPRFSAKAASIVFLTRGDTPSAFRVAGRAQGQLLLVRDAERGNANLIVRLPALGETVPRAWRIPEMAPRGPAVASLEGRDAEDATAAIRHAWERTHGR